ncbi:MAG: 3'(2'),5'-bisphosphate nucleotidase [Gammaproteobacteria bacterium]|nr:MAG: 3'(2'),5'-bisphosphate nucleotidase [Gammaproteobacteria bacterium]RTZ80956.1 MAG: 3'(2'),5'-bisphosphate nucleotidase [Gammaproteobacteria bacterium]
MTLPDIHKINQIAREAGRAVLEIYGQEDFGITEKEDQSPLTLADMASHHLITRELQLLTPEIPILSEESAFVPFEERSQWNRYWLIDPLDGTKEFVKRNGEFTVNIALIEDHRPVLGVVHAPVPDITWYGDREHGAWRQQGDNEPEHIRVASSLSQPVRVAGSRSHAGDSLKRFLEKLGEHEIVNMGSSLKLCLVAEGKADIYPRLGPTSEWDTAAAQAVVEAAGGRVTDTAMNRLDYNRKESLLNPHFLVFGDTSVDWTAYL